MLDFNFDFYNRNKIEYRNFFTLELKNALKKQNPDCPHGNLRFSLPDERVHQHSFLIEEKKLVTAIEDEFKVDFFDTRVWKLALDPGSEKNPISSFFMPQNLVLR